MKYLLILILMIGCCVSDTSSDEAPYYYVSKTRVPSEENWIYVVTIDSCEYLTYVRFHGAEIVHKQNCKYCIERNK